MSVPLHESHEEKLDRLHTFPAPPWSPVRAFTPTAADVATVRAALDRFNHHCVDIIINQRVRTMRAYYRPPCPT